MLFRIVDTIKTIFRIRLLGLIFSVTIIYALGYITFVILSVSPTELQVATHYTAFGSTHIYRDQWYNLLSFAFFGVIVVIIHAAITAKLIKENLKQMAYSFSIFSLIILVLSTVYSQSIFSIAFLE